MKLRKTLLVVAMIAMVLVALTSVVNAASANDTLYTFIKDARINVGGTEYKANDNQLLALKQYLDSHELTDAQVSTVKENITNAIKVVESEKTTNVSKLSSSAQNKISTYAKNIENAVNVKLTYTSADNTVHVSDADGKTLIEFKASESTSLVQTGSSYVPYIAVSGIALIAIAVLVVRKVTVK